MRSGMARVLKGSQFYLRTPRSSANGVNHSCLCLPSRSWCSFTDHGGMKGWVGLQWVRREQMDTFQYLGALITNDAECAQKYSRKTWKTTRGCD